VLPRPLARFNIRALLLGEDRERKEKRGGERKERGQVGKRDGSYQYTVLLYSQFEPYVLI